MAVTTKARIRRPLMVKGESATPTIKTQGEPPGREDGKFLPEGWSRPSFRLARTLRHRLASAPLPPNRSALRKTSTRLRIFRGGTRRHGPGSRSYQTMYRNRQSVFRHRRLRDGQTRHILDFHQYALISILTFVLNIAGACRTAARDVGVRVARQIAASCHAGPHLRSPPIVVSPIRRRNDIDVSVKL